MKEIRLMPEYQSWPTWYYSDNDAQDVDPHELPISKALAEDLNNWSDKYINAFNGENPSDSGFSTVKELEDFLYKGNQLYKRLSKELHGKYAVTYRPIGRDYVRRHPTD